MVVKWRERDGQDKADVFTLCAKCLYANFVLMPFSVDGKRIGGGGNEILCLRRIGISFIVHWFSLRFIAID